MLLLHHSQHLFSFGAMAFNLTLSIWGAFGIFQDHVDFPYITNIIPPFA